MISNQHLLHSTPGRFDVLPTCLPGKFMTEAGISWKQYDLSDSEADDLQVFKEQARSWQVLQTFVSERERERESNKCYPSSNRCLTRRNKKLLI